MSTRQEKNWLHLLFCWMPSTYASTPQPEAKQTNGPTDTLARELGPCGSSHPNRARRLAAGAALRRAEPPKRRCYAQRNVFRFRPARPIAATFSIAATAAGTWQAVSPMSTSTGPIASAARRAASLSGTT